MVGDLFSVMRMLLQTNLVRKEQSKKLSIFEMLDSSG